MNNRQTWVKTKLLNEARFCYCVKDALPKILFHLGPIPTPPLSPQRPYSDLSCFHFKRKFDQFEKKKEEWPKECKVEVKTCFFFCLSYTMNIWLIFLHISLCLSFLYCSFSVFALCKQQFRCVRRCIQCHSFCSWNRWKPFFPSLLMPNLAVPSGPIPYHSVGTHEGGLMLPDSLTTSALSENYDFNAQIDIVFLYWAFLGCCLRVVQDCQALDITCGLECLFRSTGKPPLWQFLFIIIMIVVTASLIQTGRKQKGHGCICIVSSWKPTLCVAMVWTWNRAL